MPVEIIRNIDRTINKVSTVSGGPMLSHTGDLPKFGSFSETVRDTLRLAAQNTTGTVLEMAAIIIETILEIVARAMLDVLLELVSNSTVSFSFVRRPSSP